MRLILSSIISQPTEILNDVYEHITNCKQLPPQYVRFDHHAMRHALIIFFRKYNADKVAFRLGFNLDELDILDISQEELLKDFDLYFDLSHAGKAIQIATGEKGKEIVLIANDVAFSLGLVKENLNITK